jgi:superfamily II DNA or RNA helicase
MVVIATYAMAAEALDIKTLTTLIMATPKTDIEQSVGRILREKHSSPIVVDIVDSHNTFKNQWRKRKTFYKKENYKIIYTTSPEYNPDTSVNSWTLVFNPVSKVCIGKNDKIGKKDKIDKKNISVKSNSSSDKSIANDSDDEVELVEEGPKDKYAPGVCLLKFKK